MLIRAIVDLLLQVNANLKVVPYRRLDDPICYEDVDILGIIRKSSDSPNFLDIGRWVLRFLQKCCERREKRSKNMF